MIIFVDTHDSMNYRDFAAALSQVCQTLDCDRGEVWVPDPETELLELRPIE